MRKKYRIVVAMVMALAICSICMTGCQNADEIASEAARRADAAQAELERAQKAAGQTSSDSKGTELPPMPMGHTVTVSSHNETLTAEATAAPADTEPVIRRTASPPVASAKESSALGNVGTSLTPISSKTEKTAVGASPTPAAVNTPAPSQSESPIESVSAQNTGAQADPYDKVATGTDFEILKVGSQGDKVAKLQEYLCELGYMHPADSAFFGPQTKAAVQEFQRNNSLIDDGIVGNSTWDVLLMDNSKKSSE